MNVPTNDELSEMWNATYGPDEDQPVTWDDASEVLARLHAAERVFEEAKEELDVAHANFKAAVAAAEVAQAEAESFLDRSSRNGARL